MIHFIQHLWYWIEVHTGTVNESGPYYGFFSGFGSDLSEIALFGFIIGMYKHHNCAVPKCPRIAHKKFEVEGTHQRTCHHHATPYWHTLLLKQYKEDYPEQHKLLNKEDYER
jgi:hypothetical protein